MEKVKVPSFRVIWNGKDITQDITPLVKRVVYEDAWEEESDSVEILCENSDGRWLYSWYPEKGDKIELYFGYEEEKVKAGTFEVDEFEFSGSISGEEIRIKGLATVLFKPLREKKTRAWENTSLNQIVSKIAKEHSLNLIIDSEDLEVKRIDQRNEGDWEFLKRLAKDYGKVVKIDGSTLAWIDKERLSRRTPVYTLTREEIISYTFSDKKHKIYKGIICRYWDAKKKKLFTYREDWKEGKPSSDYLKVQRKFDSLEEAKRYAKGMRLLYSNSEKTGRIEAVGNPLLIAGQVIEIKGFGLLDGNWLIEKSRHSIDFSSGYTTEIGVRKI